MPVCSVTTTGGNGSLMVPRRETVGSEISDDDSKMVICEEGTAENPNSSVSGKPGEYLDVSNCNWNAYEVFRRVWCINRSAIFVFYVAVISRFSSFVLVKCCKSWCTLTQLKYAPKSKDHGALLVLKEFFSKFLLHGHPYLFKCLILYS